MSYKNSTNESRFLWIYLTKVHDMFTRYRGIIYAVNAHIEVAICHSVSECQSDRCIGVGNFSTKLVALTTSLKKSEKESRFDYLQFSTYRMVQRLLKSVQPILRYVGSKRKSPVRHKISCHGNVP